MKLSYQYGTQKIEFKVVFRKRKTLSIEVESPSIITVIAPEGTPKDEIIDTVKKKSKWIVQKLYEIREVEYKKRDRQYINGESFVYMGRNYSLQIVIDEKNKVPVAKLYQGKFRITTYTKDEEQLKIALEKWYKSKAKEKIQERIDYYQRYFKIPPTKVKIKDQKKRWASCTKDQELLFNWKCIMAPAPALDYIVVHEMSHLLHMNHSDEFWKQVKKVLPDYEKRKEWLRNHGVKMEL